MAWKKQNQNRGKGRRRCGYGVEGEAAVFGLRELLRGKWVCGEREERKSGAWLVC